MRALVYTGPGRLELQERPRPTAAAGEALLAVSHIGVCGTDLLVWEGGMARVRPPVVVGHEFSATVLAGAGLTEGQRVVVEPLLTCGNCPPCMSGNGHVCVRLGLIGIDADGAAAEAVVVPAHRVHPVPDGLGLRDAALAEPTAVACHMVDRAGVNKDSQVLIVGGGPIGVLVGLVARAVGAGRVVIREPNPSRRTVAESIGFQVCDPARESVAELTAATGVGGFDIAFELTGLGVGLSDAIEATRVHGTVLMGGLPHGSVSVPTAPAVLKELDLRGSRVYRSRDFLSALDLLADGTVPADLLITKVVPLSAAIDGAFGAVRDDKHEMKVLIDVEGSA